MSYTRNSHVSGSLPEDATISELISPLRHLLAVEGTTELCVNRPGHVYVETGSMWTRHDVRELTFERCLSLAFAVASFTHQSLGPDSPLLSAVMPSGERVQIVIPPACEAGTVSITIRLASRVVRALSSAEAEGLFTETRWRTTDCLSRPVAIDETSCGEDAQLLRNLNNHDYVDFLANAVQMKKNIAIVGDTGSGKTTFMKTLCQEIPVEDRIITIEDVRELHLPRHENSVHLLYSKQNYRTRQVSPSDLVASAMRMRPDRIILAELRGSEAFDFLKALMTGHAGSITSYHAPSCALATDRFSLMAREHSEACTTSLEDLERLIRMAVDIFVHLARKGTARRVTEVHFVQK